MAMKPDLNTVHDGLKQACQRLAFSGAAAHGGAQAEALHPGAQPFVRASRQILASDAGGPSSARRDSQKVSMLQSMNSSATAGSDQGPRCKQGLAASRRAQRHADVERRRVDRQQQVAQIGCQADHRYRPGAHRAISQRQRPQAEGGVAGFYQWAHHVAGQRSCSALPPIARTSPSQRLPARCGATSSKSTHFDGVVRGPALTKGCCVETHVEAWHVASKRPAFVGSYVAHESATPTRRLQSSATLVNLRLTDSVGQPQALLVSAQSPSWMHSYQVGFLAWQVRKGSVWAQAPVPRTIRSPARTVECKRRCSGTSRRSLPIGRSTRKSK